MLSIDCLLRDENLEDVFLGLNDIFRTGWKMRGIPKVFGEDDFAHSLIVEKGSFCVAARYDFNKDESSVQGFIHEFPEFIYGDKIPWEVDLWNKRKAETQIMRDVCGRSKDLGYLFELWEDFDYQRTDTGKCVFFVDKVANSPVAVAYRNNMDSIVKYYRDNPVELERLFDLKMYEGIAKVDVFDAMRDSLDEFHSYAKSKVSENSVFVDVIDEVASLKIKDVPKIFEIFYRGLAGEKWGEVCKGDFCVDKLAENKVGLEKMRVLRSEVFGLMGGAIKL